MTKLLALALLFAVGAHAADVAGSCPKPLPALHKHHKRRPAAPLPFCTCVDEAPRTIMLTPPEPDIEPIPLSVYPYYVPLTFNDLTDYGEAPPLLTYEPIPYAEIGYLITRLPPAPSPPPWTHIPGPPAPRVRAPEIDPASGVAMFTLLAGGLAVIRGRRS